MTILYRVQDADGRGPWKPGLSNSWVDESRTFFPEILTDVFRIRLPKSGYHGYACSSIPQLRLWFSPTEYATLSAFGYYAVITSGSIIAASETQVLFTRKIPLNRRVQPFHLY